MTVSGKELTIKNILKKGKFIIPDYQREYDWSHIEIDEFLDDLKQADDEDYFIGSIVVTGDFSGDEFKVIDGQQRITTITILLAALRDKFYAMSEEALAVGMNTFIFNTNESGQEYTVLENRMPYPFLQAYVQSNPDDKDVDVQPVKDGEKKIKKAYDHLFKYIEDFDLTQMLSLRDQVLKLIAVFVTVDTESNAFTIFETLNGRGKDLSAFDLIKNQVFKNYPRVTGINNPEDKWNEIKKNVKNSSDKFLNNFWASRYKKVARRKIFKAFEQEIIRGAQNLPDDIKSFVNHLHKDSQLFEKITNPKLTDWDKFTGGSKIFFPLMALQIFKVEIANAFIMAVLRSYEEKNIKFKNLVMVLRAIEKFHFIHTAIGSQKGSGLDVFYAGYAKKLNGKTTMPERHTVLNEFIQSLKDKLAVSEVDFNESFQDKLVFSKTQTKNKALVKYVLDVFERVDSNCNKIVLDDSIEHIYPEVPVVGWPTIVEQKNIFRIGNLVLLDRDINSNIGSKLFADKKTIVTRDSTLSHTKEVFDSHTSWTEDSIKARTSLLAQRAFNTIWKL